MRYGVFSLVYILHYFLNCLVLFDQLYSLLRSYTLNIEIRYLHQRIYNVVFRKKGQGWILGMFPSIPTLILST